MDFDWIMVGLAAGFIYQPTRFLYCIAISAVFWRFGWMDFHRKRPFFWLGEKKKTAVGTPSLKIDKSGNVVVAAAETMAEQSISEVQEKIAPAARITYGAIWFGLILMAEAPFLLMLPIWQ